MTREPWNLPAWSEEDSKDLTARNALIRMQPLAPVTNRLKTGVTTVDYDGVGRGYATPAELERRRAVEQAMERRAAREDRADELSATYKANRAKRPARVRWPKPRQKPNGRWLAATIVAGRKYGRTFDTQAEAQEWLDSITGRKDD